MLPTVCVKTSKKPHLSPARFYVRRINNQDKRLHKALLYASLFYAFLLPLPFTILQYFLKHTFHFLFNPLWLIWRLWYRALWYNSIVKLTRRTIFEFIEYNSTCFARSRFHLVHASKQSTNLYDIYLMLCVQTWTPDDGRKNLPKHAEWYSVNSKIVHLVDCTIEMHLLPFYLTFVWEWVFIYAFLIYLNFFRNVINLLKPTGHVMHQPV
jgi:hypothetical protein